MSTETTTDQQQDAIAQQAMAQGAAGAAEQGQITLQDIKDDPDLIGELFAPHIDPDPDKLPDDMDVADLEAYLSAEFGRHMGLGNIPRSEWYQKRDMNRAHSLVNLQEFRRPGGMGRGCTGAVRRIMTGQEGDPGELTPYVQRQLRRAHEERTMLQSLSVNGEGFSGLTKFLAVTMGQEFGGDGGDDESTGWFGKLKGKLP